VSVIADRGVRCGEEVRYILIQKNLWVGRKERTSTCGQRALSGDTERHSQIPHVENVSSLNDEGDLVVCVRPISAEELKIRVC
jgi:hypothetical protein